MKECLSNRQVLVGVARLGGCWLRFIKGKGKGAPEPTTCTGVADGGGKGKGLMGSVLLHALLTLQFKDFLSPALLKKTKKDKYYLIGGLTFKYNFQAFVTSTIATFILIDGKQERERLSEKHLNTMQHFLYAQ